MPQPNGHIARLLLRHMRLDERVRGRAASLEPSRRLRCCGGSGLRLVGDAGRGLGLVLGGAAVGAVHILVEFVAAIAAVAVPSIFLL